MQTEKSLVQLKGNNQQPALPRWIKTGKIPDEDGEYFAYVDVKEVCGTVNRYKKVISCKLNKWVLAENETLIHWLDLPIFL